MNIYKRNNADGEYYYERLYLNFLEILDGSINCILLIFGYETSLHVDNIVIHMKKCIERRRLLSLKTRRLK